LIDFASLAEAAQASFPAEFCRIVATSENGDAGYVLFDTGPIEYPYLYGVNFERRNGRWSEGNSSNGSGWSHVGPDPDLGTVTTWGEAPPGADMVRVEFQGQVREEQVSNGVYFAAWWRVPCDGAQVIAFRIDGAWVKPTIRLGRLW
jgi:hypothetical protein